MFKLDSMDIIAVIGLNGRIHDNRWNLNYILGATYTHTLRRTLENISGESGCVIHPEGSG